MSEIEALREKLHMAINRGEKQKILAISRELDREILNYLQNQTKNSYGDQKTGSSKR